MQGKTLTLRVLENKDSCQSGRQATDDEGEAGNPKPKIHRGPRANVYILIQDLLKLPFGGNTLYPDLIHNKKLSFNVSIYWIN